MALAATGPVGIGPAMKALRAGLVTLGGVAVGLAIAALLVAVIATRLFDYELLTVRSGSMAPAIASGDLIIVKPVAIETVAEGDVILFSAGGDGIPTVHRVAGINEVELRISDPATGTVDVQTDYRLVTKGDANDQPDIQEVTAERLLGEVWFTVPGGGAITGLPLQHILLGFAACCVAAWGAWEIRAHRRATV